MKTVLVRMNFLICSTVGLKMQVIVSYLGCVRERKAPAEKGSAGVPEETKTRLTDAVCSRPSDLVFKCGRGTVTARREKATNRSEDSSLRQEEGAMLPILPQPRVGGRRPASTRGGPRHAPRTRHPPGSPITAPVPRARPQRSQSGGLRRGQKFIYISKALRVRPES